MEYYWSLLALMEYPRMAEQVLKVHDAAFVVYIVYLKTQINIFNCMKKILSHFF